MSIIVDVDFEAGNLSEFTAMVDADGDASAQAGAALAGTNYGMQVVIDDTNAAYGYIGDLADASGHARARFYFDPNSIPMDLGEEIIVSAFRNASAQFTATVRILFQSTTYRVYCHIYNDAGGVSGTTPIEFTDAPHYIEFYMQRASSAVASDGRIDVWVDGAGQQSATGVDNYDRFPALNYVRLGANAFSGTPGSGTIFFDQLVVNNDGGEIGPYSAGGSKSWYYYAQQ